MNAVYYFDGFDFIYNPETGVVTTAYDDGTKSIVQVNKDHRYHAAFLNISANEVNLLHELSHHLVAIGEGEKTCRIIYASAHNLPMPQDAQITEWKITAISYFALQKSFRPNYAHEWKALYEVAVNNNPYELRKKICHIFYRMSFYNDSIKL